MPGPRSRTLVDALRGNRPEAIEQMLKLSEDYAPGLAGGVADLVDRFRQKKLTGNELHEALREVYCRIVDTFHTETKRAILDKRVKEALYDAASLARQFRLSDLENELLVYAPRFEEASARRRQNRVPDDSELTALRHSMLEAIDALRTAILLENDVAAPPRPLESSTAERLIGAVPEGPSDKAPSELPVAAGTAAAPGSEGGRASGHARSERVDGAAVALACEKVSKEFPGGVNAVQNISLRVRRGRITGVVGLNGSGKTTLLRMVAGDLRQSSGTIDRSGMRRSSIAFVPQRPEPWTDSLEEHLRLHAAYHGRTGTQNDRLVEQVLRYLDLQENRHKGFNELSGGFQTRCALAQSLVTSPSLLVLDEPLAPLDPVAQYRFLHQLHTYALSKEALPIILSSQHIDLVEDLADDLVVMRDGRAIFCDERAKLGLDRTENTFLIRTPASEAEIAEAFAELGTKGRPTRHTSGADQQLHVVSFEMDVNLDTLQGVLIARRIPCASMSDISRSALSLLLAKEGRA